MFEAATERPRLRPCLVPLRDRQDNRYVHLWDQQGLFPEPRRMTLEEFAWVRLFDGRRTLPEIQAEAMRVGHGLLLSLEALHELVTGLKAALILDGPAFRARLAAEPVRKPSCIGCYEGEPGALRNQLRQLFTHPRGSGLPKDRTPDGSIRAVLVPHIDYGRGGLSYTWGFREVLERTEASLFVIIATSHHSPHRFSVTRKHFLTPLGLVETDQRYVDRLVEHYGDGLFDDELAHLPEHSIELEVVFLQYLYETRRPIRIVPLLVGPFHDCVVQGKDPRDAPDIRRMIAALRQVEAETKEPICYIISGDLAHIGPKFGDRQPVNEPVLQHSRKQDEALMQHAEKGNIDGYFQVIAAESDNRRICGLPPTYTLLDAVTPSRGQLLNYDQYVHPHGHESVSFASMAFYR
jgi:AmmeMemoRadiSam system protein B